MSEKREHHVAHHNVALMRVSEALELDSLLQDSAVRGYIWKRLDACHALVDAERLPELSSRLKALGRRPFYGTRLSDGNGDEVSS